MRLQGKIALVSGAARGLGAAIAERFAEEGASVVIGDIRREQAKEVTTRLQRSGWNAACVELDVSDEKSWLAAFEAVRALFGPVDILVNNAGIAMLGSIEETSFEDWRRIMAVNLDGVFLGTKAAVAEMGTRGGSIVNISSIRALVADPDSIAYDASKGGVLSLTRSAAVHCARQGYGIRINSLHPGYVMTDMIAEATAELGEVPELLSSIRDAHPIGRTGTAREIADAALFLASSEAAFMVGSALVVDGGYTAV